MQIIPTIKKTARTLPKIIENNHKDGTMKHKIRLPETPKVPIHKNIIPSFFNKLAPFSMMSLFLFLYFSFFKLKTKPNTPNNMIPIGIAIGTIIVGGFMSLLLV